MSEPTPKAPRGANVPFEIFHKEKLSADETKQLDAWYRIASNRNKSAVTFSFMLYLWIAHNRFTDLGEKYQYYFAVLHHLAQTAKTSVHEVIEMLKPESSRRFKSSLTPAFREELRIFLIKQKL
jgi:hypothetical protein